MSEVWQAVRALTVGLISDTHGLIRDSALEALTGVDLIHHAGDVGSREVFQALEEVAPVRAVRGNGDADGWGQCLAESITEEVGGRRLYVLHDIDQLTLDPAEEGFSAVVYGHSHHPTADWSAGVLFINPGSAGPNCGEQPVTIALLEVSDTGMRYRFVELT